MNNDLAGIWKTGQSGLPKIGFKLRTELNDSFVCLCTYVGAYMCEMIL